MSFGSLPSDVCAIGGVIDPDANAAGALTSDYMDMSDFESYMAIILCGTMGSSGTLAAKITQATDSSGTSAKDVTGAAITTLTDAGTDSDKQAIIQGLASDLDVANGFNHICITLTTAVATGDSSAVLLGFKPRYMPASDRDLASVDEIVTG